MFCDDSLSVVQTLNFTLNCGLTRATGLCHVGMEPTTELFLTEQELINAAEFHGSLLRINNLLDAETTFYWYRSGEQEFLQYFKKGG